VARGWPEPAWAFAASVVRELGGTPRIADLGCGDGALGRAVGLPMQSIDHLADGAGAIAADLAALPLADASVDLAVLALALIGTDWAAHLAEAARIAAPGGRVLVTELAAGPRSPAAIAAALAAHGLPGAAIRQRGRFVDLDARKPLP
jgi:SAM-dependent methyltransferase